MISLIPTWTFLSPDVAARRSPKEAEAESKSIYTFLKSEGRIALSHFSGLDLTIGRMGYICSHWTAGFEDYNKFQENARTCKSCRMIKKWLQIQFSARCEERYSNTDLLDNRIETLLSQSEVGTDCNNFEVLHLPYNSLDTHHGNYSIVVIAGSVPNLIRCAIISNTILERRPSNKWMKLWGPIHLWASSSHTQTLGEEVNQPATFIAIGKARLYLTIRNPLFDRLKLVRSWLENSLSKSCRDIYSQIGTATQSKKHRMLLPTRVLDLGVFLGHSPKQKSLTSTSKCPIRLISPPSGTTGQYLALSHRWGDKEQSKLTRKTMNSFEKSIAFRSLPKTYRDTVKVTRNLGYRYLWIDSMCIIQDDPEDWARESAKMAAVYHNASCTIAAHTAKGDNEGFLNATLKSVPIMPFINPNDNSVTSLTLASDFAHQVNKSFLSQRGWVFQERILSRRILHFTRYHIFFEDESGVKTDDIGGTGRPLMYFPWEDNKFNVQDAPDTGYWYKLVERYSKCTLTFDTDRLPAIAGLAQFFGEHNDTGRYLFGAFSKSLHQGLLWVEVNEVPEELVNGYTSGCAPPSWSWGHWKGNILFPQHISSPCQSMFEIVGESHNPHDLGFGSHPGILILRVEAAELLEVRSTTRIQPSSTLQFDPTMSWLYGITAKNRIYFDWVAFDGRRDDDCYYPKLLCVLVCKYRFEKVFCEGDSNSIVKSTNYVHYFLLLLEADESSHFYRRVGIGSSTSDLWFKKHSKKMLVNIK